MHPFAHDLLHGAARRRGGDPFVDYLAQGRGEGASPHPFVDGIVDNQARAATVAEGSFFGCDS